jgi:hypothetical protein
VSPIRRLSRLSEGIDDDAVPPPRIRLRRPARAPRRGHRDRPPRRPPDEVDVLIVGSGPRACCWPPSCRSTPASTRIIERATGASCSARPTASSRAASRPSRRSASPSASSPRPTTSAG